MAFNMLSDILVAGTLFLNGLAVLNFNFKRDPIFDDDYESRRIGFKAKELAGNVRYFRVFIGVWNVFIIFLMFTFSMPVPSGVYGQSSGPSCFSRIKMGFMMGFCVGMATGAIFGGFSCLRFGLRGRELMRNVGKGMIQGGGTFGMFMAIGTAIRC